mgnify:CR=1 FL=1
MTRNRGVRVVLIKNKLEVLVSIECDVERAIIAA